MFDIIERFPPTGYPCFIIREHLGRGFFVLYHRSEPLRHYVTTNLEGDAPIATSGPTYYETKERAAEEIEKYKTWLIARRLE